MLKILKGRLLTGLAGAVDHLGRRWLAEQPFSGELCDIYPSLEEGRHAMRTVAGYKLEAGEGERLHFSGADFLVKASADTTGGAFSIVEEIDPLDTPLHSHANEDELFYVIEGEHVFRCGDQEFHVGPGGTVFAPRGVPHAHRRIVSRTGRFLTMTSPAGFEGFFRDLSQAEASGSSMPEAYAAAARKYGIKWLNP
ncbi:MULTISPECIES: cupin domain-containing protein [unclassified Mesorhizobium]|uniref:cupin domain-containing protein n=1 Tax=unclassified Mesorhizobium TaxID=325217 RepID=UPI000F754A4A|nr:MULTISPECIES: cupin domain-containing protein [unclassified Mesorhizobium]AZO31078.1 cupin domain-containing protein [Mesorhizobium sp. M1B.F.Ca.ET.045.04.1.1]RWA72324.1 MAG: cupin domain-containing protein [Mesorhizobium sp.]RWA80171.1 MAG: cupin domain-containing protein [Mesorhizobium sp.]RWB20767.1 MAG: cupin domain-containing protein [Mesorhizobium sp.]